MDDVDADAFDGEQAGDRRWEGEGPTPDSALGGTIPPWAVSAALALITLGAYLPSFRNRHFLVFGDAALLNVEGPSWRGLGADNLHWMFTTRHQGVYQPVTWLSLGLDHLIWRSEPQGLHFSSLLMHIGAVVLLYRILLELVRVAGFSQSESAKWGVRGCAAAGALLFAVHPLQVEAVAWTAARADVLSGMLALLCAWCYLRYVRALRPASGAVWYAASVLVFGAAVLAKASVAALPMVLVLLDLYPLGRLHRDASGHRPLRPIADKVPFVAIALWAIYQASDAMRPLIEAAPETSGATRVALAGYGLLFALSKSLVPLGLSPIYERPEDLGPYMTRLWLCTSSVVLITLATLGYARRRPAWTVAWLSYVALLLPAAGTLWIKPYLWSDRYNYVANAALCAIAAGALAQALSRWAAAGARRSVLAAGVAVLACVWAMPAVATWRQIAVWESADAVLLCALRQNSRNWMARRELAFYYSERAKAELDEARVRDLLQRSAEQYRRLLEQRPAEVQVLVNLGTVYARLGEYDAATRTFRQALALDRNLFEAHYNLGIHELLVQRRADAAIGHFRAAAALNPASFESHFNLAAAHAAMEEWEQAEASVRSALTLRPDSVDAAILLAEVVLARGEEDRAKELLAAIDASGELTASARAKLNGLMRRVGMEPALPKADEGVAPVTLRPPTDPQELQRSIERLRETVRANPRDAGAYNDLANLLSMVGRTDDALAEYDRALEIKPDYVEVYLNRSIVLRRADRAAEGVAALRNGLERLPDSAPLMWTLAWLLATHENHALRNGAEALRLAERAVERTGRANAEALVSLSAAQAENGRVEDAVRTARQAAELARTQGAASLAEKTALLLEYYQRGEAYHGTR